MKSIILSSNKITNFVKLYGLNKFMDDTIEQIEKGFLDYASGAIQKSK